MSDDHVCIVCERCRTTNADWTCDHCRALKPEDYPVQAADGGRFICGTCRGSGTVKYEAEALRHHQPVTWEPIATKEKK